MFDDLRIWNIDYFFNAILTVISLSQLICFLCAHIGKLCALFVKYILHILQTVGHTFWKCGTAHFYFHQLTCSDIEKILAVNV